MPLGEGFIVTFRAANPSILADIKKYVQLNYTFIGILQGKIVESGILNHNFTLLDISAHEAQADADHFFATLEKVHPQPLRHIGAEEYLGVKKTVRTQLQEQEALQGRISYAYLAGILAEAAARLGDGHTFIDRNDFLIDVSNPNTVMLPFRLKSHFNRLLIDYAIPGLEELQGKTLIAIDNQPMMEILKPALSRISGELDAFRIAQFIDSQRLYSVWCTLFPSSPAAMSFADKGGQPFTRQIELISLQEYNDLIPENDKSIPSFHRFYHDDKTCYYQYNSFIDSEDERSYIAHLFEEMREKEVESLIIDLRNNSGGNSAIGDYLLEFLTEKPCRMFSRIDIKLSEHLFEQQTDFALYRDLTGLVVSNLIEPEIPERQKDLFKGDLHLLIGPRTFSSAADFAAVIKDYHLGQLIGEETGGVRQTAGDVLGDQLPSSTINFGVSCKVFYAPIPNVDDEDRGTLPDVSPREEELIKYEKTDNPLLYFTLDRIR